jgi:heme oxygenase (mycobilin-producing)
MNETNGEHGYRVLFMLRLRPGSSAEFLAAYEQVRWEVAAVPGHLGDQVCQSTVDPDQWLITSQWRAAADFLAWERSTEHRAAAAPMMAHVVERQSLRFTVRRETAGVAS